MSDLNIKSQTHNLDATGKSLGRLATEIATLLRGKNRPEFMPNIYFGDKVVVNNVSKMKITGNKWNDKKYYRYSGYPGGLKEEKMKEVVSKKGYGEILKKAVWNMLPKNKLRQKMIKGLIIIEDK